MKFYLSVVFFMMTAGSTFAANESCGYINGLYYPDGGAGSTLVAGVREGTPADKIPNIQPNDWIFEVGLSKNQAKNQNDKQLVFAALNSKSAFCRCTDEVNFNVHNGTDYKYFIVEDLWAYQSQVNPCRKHLKPTIIDEIIGIPPPPKK